MASYDFCYEMEDFDGDAVTVFGYDDGPAYVEFFDFDLMDRRVKSFPRGEEQAYTWAFRQGYRD